MTVRLRGCSPYSDFRLSLSTVTMSWSKLTIWKEERVLPGLCTEMHGSSVANSRKKCCLASIGPSDDEDTEMAI